MNIWRTLTGALIGLVATVAYGLLGGYLLLQSEAQRGGAIVDLNNQLVAITEPNYPVLSYLAIGVAGFALLYCLDWSSSSGTGIEIGRLLGGMVASIAIVLTSWMLDSERLTSTQGFAPGWQGWVQFGGKNPALYLIFVILCGLLVRSLSATRRALRQRQETKVEAGDEQRTN